MKPSRKLALVSKLMHGPKRVQESGLHHVFSVCLVTDVAPCDGEQPAAEGPYEPLEGVSFAGLQLADPLGVVPAVTGGPSFAGGFDHIVNVLAVHQCDGANARKDSQPTDRARES
jgi:hypothetical protein